MFCYLEQHQKHKRKEMPMKCNSTLALLSSFAVAAVALFAPTASNAAYPVTVRKPVASTSAKNYIEVHWFTGMDATGFRVYRSTTKNFKNASVIKTIKVVDRTKDVYYYYDYSAKLGVKYYYWIGYRVGNTYYYKSNLYDMGARKYNVTVGIKKSGKTSRGGDKLWFWAKVNGSNLSGSGLSWKLTWSGVHKFKKNITGRYLGYFYSDRVGEGTYTLKTGKNVKSSGSYTITWY